MDPKIGHPQGAFKEASAEISTGELNAPVSHANTNTCVTHAMGNTLDLTVPPITPSQESGLQNETTTPQNQGEIKDQLVPTPIKTQYLQATLSGHPDQNFVPQLCNNFTFGVRIGFQGQRGLRFSKKFCLLITVFASKA